VNGLTLPDFANLIDSIDAWAEAGKPK